MLQNLPTCVSLHPARYEVLRRDSLSTPRANPIPQSLVGNRIRLTRSSSGGYDPNRSPLDLSEGSTSYTTDLGSARWVSSCCLDYLQAQKLDAYRRGSQLLVSREPTTLPTIDIYV